VSFLCRWFHAIRDSNNGKTWDCRQKQKFNQQWRRENPDYFRGAYRRQKEKYGTRADYVRLVGNILSPCGAARPSSENGVGN
jgi:hypothetical protein